MLSHGLSSAPLTGAKRQGIGAGRDQIQDHRLLDQLGEQAQAAEEVTPSLPPLATQAIG